MAAIVEEVTGRNAGVQFMDYLETGMIIILNADESFVLGYLRSYIRETITGSMVVIGTGT